MDRWSRFNLLPYNCQSAPGVYKDNHIWLDGVFDFYIISLQGIESKSRRLADKRWTVMQSGDTDSMMAEEWSFQA